MASFRIFNRVTNGGTSENDMQEQVDKILKQHKIEDFARDPVYGWKKIEIPKIVLREFRVPEVGRISDHVLLINNRRVINFECKLDDIGGVIRQAKDHLRWCDYSIIIMPPDSRYVANSYKQELIEKGIGLFYWFKDLGLYEFILPKFNRNKDRDLRRKIIQRIKNSQPEPKLL